MGITVLSPIIQVQETVLHLPKDQLAFKYED